MEYLRSWLFRPGEDDGKVQTLPHRPENPANDPLLGIGSFAPEFWRLVADPAKPVPLAAPAPSAAQAVATAEPPVAEISITAKRPKRHLTDDQIANIIFNEAVSLSGAGVEEMRRQMAQTIMNAEEAFGRGRIWAKTQPYEISRQISPLEDKRLAQIRANVAEARQRFDSGEDPTNFATNFIKRPATEDAPTGVPRWATDKTGLRLESIHGPFPDSQANGAPAKNVYLWQNKLADKYYGRTTK